MTISPDPFGGAPVGMLGPYDHSVAIAPMDIDQPQFCRGLYVMTSGNVALTLRGDQQGTKLTFAVTAGQFLNLYVRRVWATGTTATVVGLY